MGPTSGGTRHTAQTKPEEQGPLKLTTPLAPARDRDALTWDQFRERFRNRHIPEGIMKMKQKEFRALKQVKLKGILCNFF
jgi:hypothetical protein